MALHRQREAMGLHRQREVMGLHPKRADTERHLRQEAMVNNADSY